MRGSSFHETIVTSILLLDSHFSVKTQSQNTSPGVPPPGTTPIVHFIEPHGYGSYIKCLPHYQ